jgi:hypothetical protein
MSGSGRVYHELTAWSRGIIMNGEARDVSSCIAAAARVFGRYADDASDHLDDPDRTDCLARRYARFGDPPIADLVNKNLVNKHLMNKTGRGLPGHIASSYVQANRNRQDMGMGGPAEFRGEEDPAKLMRLHEETYSMPLNRGVGG